MICRFLLAIITLDSDIFLSDRSWDVIPVLVADAYMHTPRHAHAHTVWNRLTIINKPETIATVHKKIQNIFV